ncbi:MAG: CBS domain-containing protein [Acidimicrobiales bacterium]
MNVESILTAKGRSVETSRPDVSVVLVVHQLKRLGIGAVVVSTDRKRVEGVVSERDIVRGLATHGPRLLDLTVADVMSRHGPTCTPADSITHVMEVMTRTRNRHLPVLEAGNLCGLVSIGDLVKHRLEELELEASVLRDIYRAGRG